MVYSVLVLGGMHVLSVELNVNPVGHVMQLVLRGPKQVLHRP